MSSERLVLKGKTQSINTLAQLGRIAVGNASAYPVELAACGWTPQNTEQLNNDVTALVDSVAARNEAMNVSMNHTTDENAARLEAKSLIRKVRQAVKILTRDEALDGVSLDDLYIGKNTRTTPSTIMFIEKIAPLVARLDTRMERFFPGQKVSEMLTQAAARLAGADTAQERARQGLPEETMAVNELKGKILDQVEELNGIASMAFDGQAELRAKFNKDLLLRGIQRRKPTTDPVSPVVPQ